MLSPTQSRPKMPLKNHGQTEVATTRTLTNAEYDRFDAQTCPAFAVGEWRYVSQPLR